MRISRPLVLTMVCLFTVSGAVRAQDDPKELLERAYKAQGGFEKLSKLKATQAKGKGIMYLPVDGKVAEVSFTSDGAAQLPDKFKITQQFEINGMKMTQVQTMIEGKATILMNGTPIDLDDNMKKEMREQVYFEYISTLIPLREPSFTITSLGESKIENKPAIGLKVSSKGHRDISLYFDKESALLIKAAYQAYDPIGAKEVAQEMYFKDFKDLDGAKYPSKSVVNQDGKKFMQLEVTEYKLSEKLDNAVFKE
jgi:hypothetical protein